MRSARAFRTITTTSETVVGAGDALHWRGLPSAGEGSRAWFVPRMDLGCAQIRLEFF